MRYMVQDSVATYYPNSLERLRIRVFGAIKTIQKAHGTILCQYYVAGCDKHGYFEDYLHGFEGSQYLQCPGCLNDVQ